jgi:PAP2 superfamily
MPQLRPSWQLSAATALILLALVLVSGPLVRRSRSTWPGTVWAFGRESAVIMALLGLWQYVGGYVHTREAGALERGRQIAGLESAWHLPSELAVQRLLLPHPWLVRAADTYYAYVHLNGMALFVVWMWWRHRDVYPRMRLTVIASTLACFLVQIVPVAPPRLLPGLGYVDTAMRYGQSVYGDLGTGMANQLSAMPSVHVGWAAIVGWYVWWCAPRRWRWVGPLHTVITVLVVVGTGNHWWLDGLVAAGFVALAMLAGHGASLLRARPGVDQRGAGVDQLPEPASAGS